jgi:uncharacterized protein
MIRKIGFAMLSGALFAVGLVVSGMTQPAKVLGFLNVGGIFAPERFGAWDASLAFVMGGALLVTSIAYAITPRPGNKPWAAPRFELPTRKDIDTKLVAGAALFGIGWGLAGYCPGPALASLLSGGLDALVFVAALVVGMWGAKRFAA